MHSRVHQIAQKKDIRRRASAVSVFISRIKILDKIIKIENFSLVIFGKIWPKFLYYSTGTLARFWNNLKNS